ncbi:MAG: twin-arginine translocation signal domain-containing protein [Anaerolineales bacterium]|nr:twin-arginine translocation signal domain-containing protein [Anaerolineales bacterium]
MDRSPVSRRGFLKLSAVLGAGLGWPAALVGTRLRLGAAISWPGAETVDLRAWPAQPPAGFDLLLAPADAAAAYIRGGFLEMLKGPRGRAHDPDGAFTWPGAFQVGVLRGRRLGRPASWAAVWDDAASGPWPRAARLVIGAALLRRGYSPNDTHPGHLAEVEADLLARAPRLAAEDAPGLAFGWAGLSTVQAGDLPLEGTPLVELDWVIPRGTADAEGARRFLALQQPAVLPGGWPSQRLVPLMLLPASAAEQRETFWQRLSAARPVPWSSAAPDFA